MKPETEKYLSYIRKRAKECSLILQHHTEGKESSIEEENVMEKMWEDFQLRYDPEEKKQ